MTEPDNAQTMRAKAVERSMANAAMCGYTWEAWMRLPRNRRKHLTQQRKKLLREQEAQGDA